MVLVKYLVIKPVRYLSALQLVGVFNYCLCLTRDDSFFKGQQFPSYQKVSKSFSQFLSTILATGCLTRCEEMDDFLSSSWIPMDFCLISSLAATPQCNEKLETFLINLFVKTQKDGL